MIMRKCQQQTSNVCQKMSDKKKDDDNDESDEDEDDDVSDKRHSPLLTLTHTLLGRFN